MDSSGVASSAWVLPALLELRELHPELTALLQSNRTDTLLALLLNGRLDISFGSIRLSHPQLRTEKVGVARAGVYCGPPHPLYRKRKVTQDDVRTSDFVAPPLDDNGLPIDGWPDEMERRVVVQVDRMRHGCEACLASPLLGVFPDLFAERISRGELRRLPIEIIPATPVFATLRPPIAEVTAAEVILDAVRARIR